MQKSYYAIIPANIRYDKKLTANAKLLYGEITALANEKGYCWANNSYFAELYGVTNKSISGWIKQLNNGGYIETQLIYKGNTKEVQQRRIYIAHPGEDIFPTYGKKVPDPREENFHTPGEEKVKDSITVFNNTTNTTKEFSTEEIAHTFIIDIDEAQEEAIKENKARLLKEKKNEVNNNFEEVWTLYPNKKGKGRVSASKKKEIYKLGEEFKRCISRYTDDVKERRKNGFKSLKYQNGSTFFNSGYVDYLDENYLEKEKKPDKPPLKLVIRDNY